MKKISFILSFLLVSIGMSADDFTTNENFTEGDEIVSTFYGSKASSNANNPCKGATIRICGIIKSKIIDENLIESKTEWLDENLNVIQQEIRVLDRADFEYIPRIGFNDNDKIDN